MSIFHKLGSVILMEQMTKRMKTELTDYFHAPSLDKKSTVLEIGLKMGAIFFQSSPQNRILDRIGPPTGTKIPKRVPLFRQKFQKE